MAANASLKAEARTGLTKGSRNQLRKQGKVPGIVYGKNITETPIAIDQKELLALLKTSSNAIIEMDVPAAGKQPVMVAEIQRDIMNRELLHVDFRQINMNEPVNTTVRLDYAGEPAGVKAGGIMQILHHEIDIRCLPQQIPDAITVDVGSLEIGSSFSVQDLAVPAGIEVKAEPTEVLVTILLPQKEAEPEQQDTEPAAKVEGEFEKKGEAAGETV